MNMPEHYLKYGFVVYLDDDKAVYDDKVLARLPYADALFNRLSGSEHPCVAREAVHVNGIKVSSPVFKYENKRGSIESYQSAYYLTDALMRKGMLPVFLPETGEVKDLLPLLTKEQRDDAILVIQILQARYIKTEKRHPSRNFMPAQDVSLDSSMLDLSDAEIMAIFGRLPDEHEDVVLSSAKPQPKEECFIRDDFIRRA
ncbi:hypothetical protein [Agaribacterium sp. ZY112]|uniref:hypothetical protein n=1 Tax=Agaribacterium sp. ZY112 TaxID=3233574 RepID=UPI0035262D52